MGVEAGYQKSPSYTEHLGDHRQYWRDIILGVNDGLVSMFLLVAGVVGGGMITRNVLLTGIAGAFAGAISMAAGEYIATKSQDEVFQGELELEKQHITEFREDELNELRDMLGDLGLQGDLRERLVAHFDADDEVLLKVMMALEFGVLEKERRSPVKAMVMSGGLFLLGSTPSVVPFIFSVTPNRGLLYAGIGTVVGLLVVGAVKTWATRGKPLRSALENLVVATAGGALAYWVGSLFDRFVRGG